MVFVCRDFPKASDIEDFEIKTGARHEETRAFSVLVAISNTNIAKDVTILGPLNRKFTILGETIFAVWSSLQFLQLMVGEARACRRTILVIWSVVGCSFALSIVALAIPLALAIVALAISFTFSIIVSLAFAFGLGSEERIMT